MPFTGGMPETACGAGSTFENTASVREHLPRLFSQLRVMKLLDAPCGDFNWMSKTDLYGIEYIGVDYDATHCAWARARESQPSKFRPHSKTIVTMDVCRDRLPSAGVDLMLCRDFLQHLPNSLAQDVLNSFKASGIPWLLTTSHDNAENVDITDAGMFRRLNLTVGPFSLPAPRQSIPDGAGRILGLWHRDDWI